MLKSPLFMLSSWSFDHAETAFEVVFTTAPKTISGNLASLDPPCEIASSLVT